MSSFMSKTLHLAQRSGEMKVSRINRNVAPPRPVLTGRGKVRGSTTAYKFIHFQAPCEGSEREGAPSSASPCRFSGKRFARYDPGADAPCNTCRSAFRVRVDAFEIGRKLAFVPQIRL